MFVCLSGANNQGLEDEKINDLRGYEMQLFFNVLFVCIFSLFVIGVTLIRTSDEAVSFFRSFIVSIWTVISVGAFLAFIINFLQIPIMVRSMAVVYGGCAVLVWTYLLRKRNERIQKLIFHWSDFFNIICCIAIWGYVFIKVFGFDLTLSYGGVDAGAHFERANQIMVSHKLNKMYFAALYNSLIMELFQPFLIEETMYKAFIIADASLNLLNLCMFYVLASEFIKLKFCKIVMPIIMIFYFFGWPVWSWIAGGFVYFGVAITAYLYGIYVLKQAGENYNRKHKIYYFILSLLTLFCIVECYSLFSPIYLITMIIYVLYLNKKKLSKQYIIYGLIGSFVLIVGVFLAIYWGYFGGKTDYFLKSIRANGGVHRELYKDFMFLIPINTFVCATKYKEKRIDLISIAVLTQLGVVAVALVANICGVISDYYYFKLYYLGWALQFVGVAYAIEYFWNKKRQIIHFCILPILVTAILETTGLSQRIIWSASGNSEMFPIITQSIQYTKTLHGCNTNRKDNFITVCKWINDNLLDDDVPIVTSIDDVLTSWYFVITGGKAYSINRSEEEDTKQLDNMLQSFQKANNQFFTVVQDTEIYEKNINWFAQFDKIYDDGCYGVYVIEN